MASSNLSVRPAWHALWAWMTLLVVIISALPAGGYQPAQRAGSAFDPTNVQVSVAARKSQVSADKVMRDSDAPDLLMAPPPAGHFVALDIRARQFTTSGEYRSPAPVHDTRRSSLSQGPRAPPHYA